MAPPNFSCFFINPPLQKLDELSDLRRRLPSLRGRDRGLGHRDAAVMKRQVKALQEQVSRDVLQVRGKGKEWCEGQARQSRWGAGGRRRAESGWVYMACSS